MKEEGAGILLFDPGRDKSLLRLLRELVAISPEMQTAAVSTTDGHILASVLGPSADAKRFGAICASLLALADTATWEVARGQLRQVLLEGASGSMFLVDAGSNAVLTVTASKNASLERVWLEAKKTAAAVDKVLQRYA